jgi:GNAT superfamily N-acetyltransferase
MGIVIREASSGDGAVLLDLIDALAAYERLAPPGADARERLLRDGFGTEPRFKTYLAELDGRAVGYAIVLSTYSSFLALPTLYIEDLFVRSEARGKGVGHALFKHLARQAVAQGCGRMEWAVLDWNRLAIAFYERAGARRLTEWFTYRLTREQLDRLAAS